MEVILLHDVPKVGKKYDVAKVASGFAQNFLIPKKLAEYATKNKIARIEEIKKQIVEEQKIQDDLLVKNIDELKNITVTLSEKANDQGHLFKGIHTKEIERALKEQSHISLPENAIVLEEPIKTVGEHTIPVKIDGSKTAFTLTINAKEEK